MSWQENFSRHAFFCPAHKTRFHDCSPVFIKYHFTQSKKQLTKPRWIHSAKRNPAYDMTFINRYIWSCFLIFPPSRVEQRTKAFLDVLYLKYKTNTKSQYCQPDLKHFHWLLSLYFWIIDYLNEVEALVVAYRKT